MFRTNSNVASWFLFQHRCVSPIMAWEPWVPGYELLFWRRTSPFEGYYWVPRRRRLWCFVLGLHDVHCIPREEVFRQCYTYKWAVQHRRPHGKDRINCFRYHLSVDVGRHVTSEFKRCLAVRCQWSFLVSSVTLPKYILRILLVYFLFLMICLSLINSYLILHTLQVRLRSNHPDPLVWRSCHQPQGCCPLCSYNVWDCTCTLGKVSTYYFPFLRVLC